MPTIEQSVVKEGDSLGGIVLMQKHREGAHGTIWLAKDGGRDVVVKVLPPSLYTGQVGERLKKVLDHAKRRTHRRLLLPYKTCFDTPGDDAVCFWMASEFMNSKDVRELFSNRNARTSNIVSLGLAVCETLKELPYHGNLKPENMTLNVERRIDTDGVTVEDKRLYLTDQAMNFVPNGRWDDGDAAYLSPEQASNEKPDNRSDIYAMGIIMYEMITQTVPFQNDRVDRRRTLDKQRTEPPLPPRSVNPQTPEPLNRIIMRCLEKKPTDRYQSWDELAAELQAFRETLGTETIADPPLGGQTQTGGNPIDVRYPLPPPQPNFPVVRVFEQGTGKDYALTANEEPREGWHFYNAGYADEMTITLTKYREIKARHIQMEWNGQELFVRTFNGEVKMDGEVLPPNSSKLWKPLSVLEIAPYVLRVALPEMMTATTTQTTAQGTTGGAPQGGGTRTNPPPLPYTPQGGSSQTTSTPYQPSHTPPNGGNVATPGGFGQTGNGASQSAGAGIGQSPLVELSLSNPSLTLGQMMSGMVNGTVRNNTNLNMQIVLSVKENANVLRHWITFNERNHALAPNDTWNIIANINVPEEDRHKLVVGKDYFFDIIVTVVRANDPAPAHAPTIRQTVTMRVSGGAMFASLSATPDIEENQKRADYTVIVENTGMDAGRVQLQVSADSGKRMTFFWDEQEAPEGKIDVSVAAHTKKSVKLRVDASTYWFGDPESRLLKIKATPQNGKMFGSDEKTVTFKHNPYFLAKNLRTYVAILAVLVIVGGGGVLGYQFVSNKYEQQLQKALQNARSAMTNYETMITELNEINVQILTRQKMLPSGLVKIADDAQKDVERAEIGVRTAESELRVKSAAQIQACKPLPPQTDDDGNPIPPPTKSPLCEAAEKETEIAKTKWENETKRLEQAEEAYREAKKGVITDKTRQDQLKTEISVLEEKKRIRLPQAIELYDSAKRAVDRKWFINPRPDIEREVQSAERKFELSKSIHKTLDPKFKP